MTKDTTTPVLLRLSRIRLPYERSVVDLGACQQRRWLIVYVDRRLRGPRSPPPDRRDVYAPGVAEREGLRQPSPGLGRLATLSSTKQAITATGPSPDSPVFDKLRGKLPFGNRPHCRRSGAFVAARNLPFVWFPTDGRAGAGSGLAALGCRSSRANVQVGTPIDQKPTASGLRR